MTYSERLGAAMVLALALSVGCGGDGGGGATDDDGGAPDGRTPECPAGQQDVDGDGMCFPDCASTPCEHGRCAVDGDSGLAVCTCHDGYRGHTCEELDAPESGEVVFWLDADDSATITVDGNAVEAWTDKGEDGIASTLQSSVFAPERVAGALNGRPVVRFDPTGNAKYLHWDGVDGLVDADYTIFMVARINAGSDLVIDGNGSTQGLDLDANGSTIQLVHDADPDANQVVHSTSFYGDAGYTADEFHLLTLRRSSTELAIWVDGNYRYALPATSPTDLSEALDLYIGANEAVSQVFDGDLAELIVVADDLIYGQRKPIEDYLAAKWFGGAFERNPTAFGVARIWLDANQVDTLTTGAGGAVSAWSNLGLDGGYFGNASFADARPVLVDGAIGGRPAVRFDGGDALVQNEIDILGGEDGAYTVVLVLNPPSSGSEQLVFKATTAGELEGLRMSLMPTVPNFTYQHVWPAGEGGDAVDQFAPTLDPSGPLLVKIERSGGNYSVVYGDMTGTFSATSDPILAGDADSSLNWGIGGEEIADPGDGLVGDVAELVVLNDAPGNSEETALLDLLRDKWGL
ncbi:MAG: hypothetical protein ACOC97_02625 [Myxococcota bacterium]